MNPDTINYPIPHYPAMYYHYTSSLPPPSSDNIQYHHFYYYSIPPPPKFYVPTQSIQQQYYENYHRQRYLHQHRYYQHNYDHIPTRSPIPYKTRKSKSSMTDNTKPMIMGTDTKTKPFPIKKSMKSAVKWFAHTFCFCFTDDTLSLIEFNDTYNKTTEKGTKVT